MCMPKLIKVAVVTTFRPTTELLERLTRVISQVDKVILVDDSGADAIAAIRAELVEINVDIISNCSNIGIAASLNKGINRALDVYKCDYIVTFDDDTLIPDGYIDSLMKCFCHQRPKSLGIVCGSYEGSIGLEDVTNDDIVEKRNLITSGCIYPSDLFREIGLFDERLFIDLVDFDFCTRVRSAGYCLAEVSVVKMSHTIGEICRRHILFLNVIVYNHQPFRLFYQVRNILLYSRKHCMHDPLFSLYLYIGLIKIIIKAILFEERKLSRLYYITKGVWWGVRNKGGRLV